MADVLMQAEHLHKEFHVPGGVVSAVSDVSLTLYKGETLALVGESGCGKSTLGRVLLNLIEPSSGKVVFDGQDLSTLSAREMRSIRRRMQIIFQDPFASLDPRMTVGQIIEEPLKIHGLMPDRAERRAFVCQLMERIGIRPEYYTRSPHQFSGGQRQRIGIARALAVQPKLIIADEPVSALDVSIQAQIINLLCDLQEKLGLSILFISHDLRVVRYISDRVAVMYLGAMVETAPTDTLYTAPAHPYTKVLLAAAPSMEENKVDDKKAAVLGELPSPINLPSGCRFHPRCPYADELCRTESPKLRCLAETPEGPHMCACHHPLV